MLYWVQKINGCNCGGGWIDGDSRLRPGSVHTAIIGEAAIRHVLHSPLPEHGQNEAVLVELISNHSHGDHIHCVGTIDTFATPWEPKSKPGMSDERWRMLTDCPSINIRRAKPGIEDGPFFEGQPDEEPDGIWLARITRENAVDLSAATTEPVLDRLLRIAIKLNEENPTPTWHSVDEPDEDGKRARDGRIHNDTITDATWLREFVDEEPQTLSAPSILRLRAMADRLEKLSLPPATAWHSVDEPPEHGMWCWVTDGTFILVAEWQSDRGRFYEPHSWEEYAVGRITHWQQTIVPELPESKGKTKDA